MGGAGMMAVFGVASFRSMAPSSSHSFDGLHETPSIIQSGEGEATHSHNAEESLAPGHAEE